MKLQTFSATSGSQALLPLHRHARRARRSCACRATLEVAGETIREEASHRGALGGAWPPHAAGPWCRESDQIGDGPACALAAPSPGSGTFSAKYVPFESVKTGKSTGEEYSLDEVIYRCLGTAGCEGVGERHEGAAHGPALVPQKPGQCQQQAPQ